MPTFRFSVSFLIGVKIKCTTFFRDYVPDNIQEKKHKSKVLVLKKTLKCGLLLRMLYVKVFVLSVGHHFEF